MHAYAGSCMCPGACSRLPPLRRGKLHIRHSCKTYCAVEANPSLRHLTPASKSPCSSCRQFMRRKTLSIPLCRAILAKKLCIAAGPILSKTLLMRNFDAAGHAIIQECRCRHLLQGCTASPAIYT
eukprot:364950-Chlamydomonas_euryale.AAC.20